ncbi:MAG TPA: carboxypeptidase-like regulatory domain-containing protein, partial [Gemmatimonadales bacterium]|nr:carboxypeptidase-like regulatory domain-containing protein [Gemmatimonadales bacterium]
MRLGLFLVAAWLGAGPLPGQGNGIIYGTVSDTSGRAIRGAQVLVTGQGLRTMTDRRGTYRIPGVPSGRIELRAAMIGYAAASDSLLVIAADSVRRDFRLWRAAILVAPPLVVPEVVVTAAKRPQSLGDVVPSVALMSDSDIAKRAVNTIDEAVDKAPGVQFLSGQVNIRGSSG